MGDEIDEAIANAETAILMILEDYIERGEALPKPSPIQALSGRREFKGWAWAFANVDLAKLNGKAVRINITLPERLSMSIDSFAHEHGESRRGFLARAATQVMAA